MSEQAQTWHYGLVARWWAEFNTADPEELAFYQGFVERNGEPALDLACGAGRLLLPMLRAGLDVDGCDVSADMLARCRELADAEGMAPQLYQRAMHALDLPRKYRTHLHLRLVRHRWRTGAGHGGVAAVLRPPRARRHADFQRLSSVRRSRVLAVLAPGDSARRCREPWPESDLRKRTADGDEIALSSTPVDLDPLKQQTHARDPLPPLARRRAAGGGIRHAGGEPLLRRTSCC